MRSGGNKINIKLGGLTFQERKDNLINFIEEKYGQNYEVGRLIELLKPVPLKLSEPLTNEVLTSLANKEHILDVRDELEELVYRQNTLELKGIKKTQIHLEMKKIELIGQLVELKTELSKVEAHEYRPDISELIVDLEVDKEKIHDLYTEVIKLMNEWNGKKN